MGRYERQPKLTEFLKGQQREQSQLHRPSRPSVQLEVVNQSIPDNADTTISWTVANSNRFGMWVAASPTVITMPKTGLWLHVLEAAWESNATGRRVIGGGGAAKQSVAAISGAITYQSASSVTVADLGGLTNAMAYQNSGAARTLSATLTVVYLAV